MSLFTDGGSTTGSPQGDNTGVNQTTEDFLSVVVQSKGEQWQDPQVLAKGYVHAQKRIAELEALAKEAEKSDYAKELLETLKATQAPQPVGEKPKAEEHTGVGEQKTTVAPDDIQSLVEKSLTALQLKERKEQNLREVRARLEEEFGTEANATLQKKMSELGLTKEKMDELASDSPQAFMALVGVAPKPQGNRIPDNSVNTISMSSKPAGRTAAYYRELRRKNPSQFFKPEIQKQMMADAAALGSSYFD